MTRQTLWFLIGEALRARDFVRARELLRQIEQHADRRAAVKL